MFELGKEGEPVLTAKEVREKIRNMFVPSKVILGS